VTEVMIPTASVPVTGADFCGWEALEEGLRDRAAHTSFRLDATQDPVLRDRVLAFDRTMLIHAATLERGFEVTIRDKGLVADTLKPLRVLMTGTLNDLLAYMVVPASDLPDLSPQPPVAFIAVKQIKDWLGIPQQAVLDAASVSKSTFHSWKGVNTPHAGSEGRLWELHMLVKSILEVKGETATKVWLKQHPEVRRDLVAGRFHAVASAAFGAEKRQADPSRQLGAAGPDEKASLHHDPFIEWKLAPDDVTVLDE
jgi:hypothetical protein